MQIWSAELHSSGIIFSCKYLHMQGMGTDGRVDYDMALPRVRTYVGPMQCELTHSGMRQPLSCPLTVLQHLGQIPKICPEPSVSVN